MIVMSRNHKWSLSFLNFQKVDKKTYCQTDNKTYLTENKLQLWLDIRRVQNKVIHFKWVNKKLESIKLNAK